MKKVLLMILILILIVGSYFYFKEEEKAYQLILNNSLDNGLYQDNINTVLDLDEEFASLYYFKGGDINNYFWHENQCFVIVNIATNKTIKIMHLGRGKNNNCEEIESITYKITFSDEETNKWHDSNILKLFKSWEENNQLFDDNFDLTKNFVTATWFIGNVFGSDKRAGEIVSISLADHIKEERAEDQYQGFIGLISLSDYLKANEGILQSFAQNTIARENYLFRGKNFWTMTGRLEYPNRAYGIQSAQDIPNYATTDNPNSMSRDFYVDKDEVYFYPALYISNEVDFIGQGSRENPYKIK